MIITITALSFALARQSQGRGRFGLVTPFDYLLIVHARLGPGGLIGLSIALICCNVYYKGPKAAHGGPFASALDKTTGQRQKASQRPKLPATEGKAPGGAYTARYGDGAGAVG